VHDAAPQRLFTLVLLAALASCRLFPGGSGREVGEPSETTVALAGYEDRLAAGSRRLAELDVPGPGAVLLSQEAREAARGAAERLLGVLGRRQQFLAELDSRWEACSPEDLQKALDDDASLRAEVLEEARRLSLSAEAAASEREALALEEAAGRIPAAGARSTREFIAVLGRLDALAAVAGSHLAAAHTTGTTQGSETHPARGVFHFLALHRQGASGLARRADEYAHAWKEWVGRCVQGGRFDDALAVISLVTTQAREFRPNSAQKLVEVAHASLEHLPSPQACERMERSLVEIEAALKAHEPEGHSWDRALKKARAALRLGRARGATDPRDGVPLAIEALKLDRQIAEHVHRFLMKAAAELGRRELEKGLYKEALGVYTDTIFRGAVPGAGILASTFRSSVVARALEDAAKRLGERRFAEARATAEEASTLARSLEEREKARDALYRSYQEHSDHLLQKDPERCIALANDALRAFPSDPWFSARVDQALYSRLEASLGDPRKSWKELGAEEIRSRLRATVGGMTTPEGAVACQMLLDRTGSAWREELLGLEDTAEASALAREIARLEGTRPPPAPGSEARSVSRERRGEAGQAGGALAAGRAGADAVPPERLAPESGAPQGSVAGGGEGGGEGRLAPGGRPTETRAYLRTAGCVTAGASSLAVLGLIPLLTRRKGLLGFRWYAAGAVVTGLAAGFFAGAL
jgi:hypothetical protein